MGRAKVARRAPDRPKCSKKHASQLPFFCLKLRVSGNICWALVFGQCTANIFLKKYWLHLKLHLGFFHLIVVPHTVRDKIKVENDEVTKHDWGMILTSEVSETCYGIYEFWPWTNRTKEIKQKLRNRYFFQRWWLTERRPTPKDHIAHNVNLLHPLS